MCYKTALKDIYHEEISQKFEKTAKSQCVTYSQNGP